MKLNHYKIILILYALTLFTYSCKSTTPKEDEVVHVSEDSISTIETRSTLVSSTLFSIKGDFDGDGEKETLTEKYTSSIDGKLLSKNNDNDLEYEEYRSFVAEQKPKTTLICSNSNISNFLVTKEANQKGLLYLKNEGDLNQDGTDELSYVVSWMDHSAMNSVHIVSYKNGKWEELYSFSIREHIFSQEKFHLIQKSEGKNSEIAIKFVNEQGLEEFLIVNLDDSEKSPSNSRPLEERFIVTDDSIHVPEFTIELEIDAAAEKLFANGNETLITSITIEGFPRDGLDVSDKDYYGKEQDAIYLMSKDITIDLETKNWTMDLWVSQEAFLALVDPNFRVTFNFYSGRKSSDMNLIDASYNNQSILAKPILFLRGKTHSLKIKML